MREKVIAQNSSNFFFLINFNSLHVLGNILNS